MTKLIEDGQVTAQSRSEAKSWLSALIRTSPEIDSPIPDQEALQRIREELRQGQAEYSLNLHADPETFLSMAPEDIAEQLLAELESVVKVIRRERRLVAEAGPEPNYGIFELENGWAYSVELPGGSGSGGNGFPTEADAEEMAHHALGVFGVSPTRAPELAIEIPINEEVPVG